MTAWCDVHDNLVLLTRWLADAHYGGSGVADAVEKPWNYDREFICAKMVAAHEQENPSGDCSVVTDGDYRYHCGGTTECNWAIDASEVSLDGGASMVDVEKAMVLAQGLGLIQNAMERPRT